MTKRRNIRTLKEIGLKKGWIYEAIVSTFNGKRPHAAPIGVWTQDFETLITEIYEGSNTLRNIKRVNEFAVNFVDDMTVFFKVLHGPQEINYEKSKTIHAPTVKGASVILEVRLREIRGLKNRYRLKAKIQHLQINHIPRLINRAEPLLLESLILGTKVGHLASKRIEYNLKENYRVISKVAPRSV